MLNHISPINEFCDIRHRYFKWPIISITGGEKVEVQKQMAVNQGR